MVGVAAHLTELHVLCEVRGRPTGSGPAHLTKLHVLREVRGPSHY